MRTFLSPLALRAALAFAFLVLSGSVACEVHTHRGRSTAPRYEHHDNGRHRGHQKHRKHQKSRHHDNGKHRGHHKHHGRGHGH